MNKELRLRKLIREEIMKSLITEKFQSQKLTALYSMMSSGDKQFFDKTAKSAGYRWSDVVDNDIASGANPGNGYMNIFIVDSDDKKNPYAGTYEWDRIYKGII